MRIFFTTPPYNLLKNAYGIRSEQSDGFEPPLGLAYLASVLIEAGHRAVIYDSLPDGGTNRTCL